MPPLPRHAPAWYNVHLPGLLVHLYSEVSSLGSAQIRLLTPFVAPVEYFEHDGVHLNRDAGVQFIQFIIQGVDQVLPVLDCSDQIAPPSSLPPSISQNQVPPIGLPAAVSLPPPLSSLQTVRGLQTLGHPRPPGAATLPSPITAGSSLDQVGVALNSLTQLHATLSKDVLARKNQDNLIFARIKEDLDFEYNRNRENRFTITGYKPTSAPPSDVSERKDFFKKIVSDLVAEACPDLPLDVVSDVFVNMRYGRGPPFIEGKMKDSASSSSFRSAAARLAKGETPNPNFAGLFVANSVTLATRVRIEILRALSDTLRTASVQAYVQPFTSRPVLHLRMRDPLAQVVQGANRSYTFVEAVGRWGHQLSQYSLIPAYRKARPAFIGALEQYFVVLQESGPNIADDPISKIISWPSGPNSMPLGSQGFNEPQPGPSSSSGRTRPWFRGSRSFRGAPRGQSIKRPHSSSTQDVSSTPSKRKNDEDEVEAMAEESPLI